VKNYLFIFIIVSLGIVIYSNSLGNDFVWDDNLYVVTNNYIRSLKFIPLYFTSPHALSTQESGGANLYRPFTVLSYAFDYFLWKLNPMGYHITNLMLHIFNSILVFYFILILTKDKNISFFSSVIFLAHPVQTEAVSWISGRSSILFLFFYLIALISYIAYKDKKIFYLYLISVITFLFSIFSKEMAASFPFILISYDILYGGNEKMMPRVLRYFPYFLILEFYLMSRCFVIGNIGEMTYYAGSFASTFFTLLTGIIHYLKILIFPVNLSAEYFGFPISKSLIDYKVLGSLCIIMILLRIGFMAERKSKHISFSIFLFFIALLPVMHILPANVLIAERFLYLPLIGYAVIVSAFFGYIRIKFKDIKNSKVFLTFFQFVIIAVYSIITMSRNSAWADDLTVYKNILKTCPDNYRMHYNLSVVYINKYGDIKKAYEEAYYAIELAPDYIGPRILLAKYFVRMNKIDEAVSQLNYVLKIKPDNIDAYLELASIYKMQHKYDEAIINYKKGIACNDRDIKPRLGMASIYILKDEIKSAIYEYEKILSLEIPYHYRAYLAVVLLELGDLYAEIGEINKAHESWSSVYKDFAEQTVFKEISMFLVDKIPFNNFLDKTETWQPEFRAVAYYYIGIKKELERDIKTAVEYYKKINDMDIDEITPIKMSANRRLMRLTNGKISP